MSIGLTDTQDIYGENFLELDSHADVAVLGANCRIIHETNRTVTVHGYDPSLGSTVRKVVSGCFAYDDPNDGNCKLLIIHQGLHVPNMRNSLIPPFQMRDNDITVNDCPKMMIKDPTITDHAILIPRDNDIPYLIPLYLQGTISSIPVRRPTDDEWIDDELERFELTYETPTWEHGDPERQVHEEALMKQSRHEDQELHDRIQVSPVESVNRAQIMAISNTLLPDTLASALKEQCHVSSVFAKKTSTSNGLTAEMLARNWKIPLSKAKRTIEMTTQLGVRTRPNDLVRRFKVNDRLLRYNRLTSNMYTDTLESKTVSKRKNKYCQVFTVPPSWIKAYPMEKKSDAHHALSELLRDVGAPEKLIMDGSKEQTQGLFRQKCRDAGIRVNQTEPYTPQSNRAELAIRELKKSTRRKMIATKTPLKLWDDCMELEADIISHTADDNFHLQGQVPNALVTGHTADISRLAEFGWYQWVYWYDQLAAFPDTRKVLGRYLGPTRDIGMALTAKLLKRNGQYAWRSSFIALTDDDMKNPEIIQAMTEFDAEIAIKLGDTIKPNNLPQDEASDYTPDYLPYRDEITEPMVFPERDDIDTTTFDPYINAEVILPLPGDGIMGQKTAKVKSRKRDVNGDLIGKASEHPMLDTRVYTVEFPDGTEADYSANVIAENMFAQCDSEGNQFLLVSHIVDHASDNTAVKEADAYISVNGRQSRRKTTKGWKFCVEWKDGTTSWVPLNILKEQIPVEIAEYAVTHSIAQEPAFSWWVPFTLKKRDFIISAVNKRYHKTTHKYGIRIPKSVDEAHQIDKENGNTKWADAIAKEMKNVMVAFKMLGMGAPTPVGYQKIRCHIIFDVKMDNFKFKARLVAGGHTTEAPSSLTYASVVSRDSVRIALTMAALNDLEVKAGDIQNAYLTAPCTEKIVTICGPEFGEHQGQTAMIVRALYGLKSSGASFRNHLASCMRMLGYTSCLADPDVWLRAETRPDGFEYYAYVLLYVDDALVIHHDGMKALQEIDHHFAMKQDSMGDPDIYLGCKLSKHVMPNGVVAWLQSPSKYIQEAVRKAEQYFIDEYSLPFKKKCTSPFTPNYRPELDTSPELDPTKATRFMSDIGVLRWIVEIGRVDIVTEVSLLSSHLAMPREGHLEQVWHIYSFLKNRHNGCLIFDPTYPEIDRSSFNHGESWKDYYGDVKELLPPNAPPPRGREAVLRVFVDSDHAGESLTRRSRTGYLLYLNMAPILWYSKKQGTIETSVFGAEFVAMKVATEVARGMRYKLRMMGIPVHEPTFMYGDNMSVIKNTQRPESTLSKKSNSICYHFIRESVAMGETLTAHVRSEDNPADICTKIMAGGVKRDKLTSMIMHFVTNITEPVSRSLKKLFAPRGKAKDG